MILSSLQEADTTSNECQAPSNEEEAKGAEIAPEAQSDENLAPPADKDGKRLLSQLKF